MASDIGNEDLTPAEQPDVASDARDQEVTHLEAALRDERSMRFRSEERTAELIRRVDLWRTRADERLQRIRKLEAEREIPWIRHTRNRVRKSLREQPPTLAAAPPPSPTPTVAEPPEIRLKPRFPVVRVAAAVETPHIAAVVDTMHAMRLDEIHDADVVMLEPAAFAKLPSDARQAVADWSALPGRQPLIVWSSDGNLGDALGLTSDSDVVAVSDGSDATRLAEQHGRLVFHTSPTFNPNLHNPMQPRTSESLLDASQLQNPSTAFVERAAAGDVPDDRTAVALRRWAYRNHAPWVRARQLMDAAGHATPDITPTIAVIMVSNRPDLVTAAATRILEQRYPNMELVVALHGSGSIKGVSEVIHSTERPGTVIQLPERYTLGECLNAAIESTNASVLAKIDDDDFYGPSYLDDALHAMAYTDTDIVGKGAHFTYVGSHGQTVLRRGRQEEQFIDTATVGASLVFSRAIWDAVRFPHRTLQEDTWFLGAARSTGARVFANTRYEFLYMRDGNDHTWQPAEDTFMSGAEPAWDGLDAERTFVTDID